MKQAFNTILPWHIQMPQTSKKSQYIYLHRYTSLLYHICINMFLYKPGNCPFRLYFLYIPGVTGLAAYSALARISFLLYEPHDLHTLCDIIKDPHLLHLTKFGTVIFQFALLLSLRDFEDLFFGQIDILYSTS